MLELVCKAEQPVGAYHLLDELRQSGRSAAPPTVYRALDLACAHPQHPHAAVFLVCSHCGHTQEVHTASVIDQLRQQADEFDFAITHASVEVTGLCSHCRKINEQ